MTRVQAVYALGVEFLGVLRQRNADGLRTWLEVAQTSGLEDLRTFALGLEREGEPLFAACSSPLSNGQTEGVVNRIKVVKRQMYGRGSLRLLKNRVLLAL
jgi:transposase